MVAIKSYPFVCLLRSVPSRHVLHWRGGRLQRSGRGVAYWFRPLDAAVAEVPCDDRDMRFLVHGPCADFQEMTAQGVLTWRVTDPELLAERIDFSVDLSSGPWLEQPLEQLSDILTDRVQQLSLSVISSLDVRGHLERGIEVVRDHVAAGLAELEALADLGVEIVSVSVTKLAPSAELERALQTPAFEAMQQKADEATFERRALALEKERIDIYRDLPPTVMLGLAAREFAGKLRSIEHLNLGGELVVESEMEDGVVFGDGMEEDHLSLPWGQPVTLRRAAEVLRLV